MKFGHTTASLLIAKLQASSRQSTLAKELHEYGRLIRTLYICRYIADEELRRRRTPPAQQGRESACAAPRAILRPPRPRPSTTSR